MTDEVQRDAEEWRVIAEFPEYVVSNYGDIRRVDIDSRNHKLTGRNLKQTVVRGYANVTLCQSGIMRNRRVNRLVCEAFHGRPPSLDHHAAHDDGISLNNYYKNLRWAMPIDNEADKRRHGTAAVGEKHWSKSMPERRARGIGHGRSKLTDDDVRKIRIADGKQREIARTFGVSQRTIWNIKSGKIWRHVA